MKTKTEYPIKPGSLIYFRNGKGRREEGFVQRMLWLPESDRILLETKVQRLSGPTLVTVDAKKIL
jgi:hypothetical protein